EITPSRPWNLGSAALFLTPKKKRARLRARQEDDGAPLRRSSQYIGLRSKLQVSGLPGIDYKTELCLSLQQHARHASVPHWGACATGGFLSDTIRRRTEGGGAG